MKLAVIFPGIGYHSDKPLLYYSKKVAQRAGYEIMDLLYSDLPYVDKGNIDSMRKAQNAAYEQINKQLEKVDFSKYESVLFISKSLGTVLASRYAGNHDMKNVVHLCYTPVEDTFEGLMKAGRGYVFHGLSDPWCSSSTVYSCMNALTENYNLITFEGANHSLETGDTEEDILIIQKIVNFIVTFLN